MWQGGGFPGKDIARRDEGGKREGAMSGRGKRRQWRGSTNCRTMEGRQEKEQSACRLRYSAILGYKKMR